MVYLKTIFHILTRAEKKREELLEIFLPQLWNYLSRYLLEHRDLFIDIRVSKDKLGYPDIEASFNSFREGIGGFVDEHWPQVPHRSVLTHHIRATKGFWITTYLCAVLIQQLILISHFLQFAFR